MKTDISVFRKYICFHAHELNEEINATLILLITELEPGDS